MKRGTLPNLCKVGGRCPCAPGSYVHACILSLSLSLSLSWSLQVQKVLMYKEVPQLYVVSVSDNQPSDRYLEPRDI